MFPIADMLPCAAFDPLGLTVVHDFEDALPELEGRVAEQIVAGYCKRESVRHLGITLEQLREVKAVVQEKARMYLV